MNDIPRNENEQNNYSSAQTNAEAANIDAESITEETVETFDLKKEVFEWFYTIAIALLIAFLIKAFIFDVVRVDGSSMYPTLINNDRLIITKIGYSPKSQDIIVLDSTYKNRQEYFSAVEKATGKNYSAIGKLIDYFKLPKNLKRRYYIKRIIGMPGQTVDIIDGKVYVDGELFDEVDYYDGITPITDPTVSYPVTVQEGYVFVMGDNRPGSKDSRSSELGQVPIKAILGKAQVRIWPLNTISLTK